MNTTIYLIRHSEPLKNIDYLMAGDSLQVKNEKNILSPNGEKYAEKLSLNKEMENIDVVISSKYVRAMSTAKYIALHNGVNINVIEDFDERKFGIDSYDELPENFEEMQKKDPNFKMEKGECQSDVAKRMYSSLIKVLNECMGKRVVIVSHATAITFLFMKLGIYKNKKIYFKNQVLIDDNFNWDAPEVFKLSFIDKELVSIENIKIKF